MRILWIRSYHAPAYGFGGPVSTGVALCKGLTQAGHDVTVLATDVRPQGHLNVPRGRPVDVAGNPVVFVHGFRRIPLPFFAPAMMGAAKEMARDADIILASATMTYPQTVAFRIARFYGKPFLPILHNALSQGAWQTRGLFARAYMELIERPILRRSTAIVFTSEGEKASSAAHRLRPPAVVCPLCIDLDAHRPLPQTLGLRARLSIPEEAKVVLFVGRLTPWKGVDELIRGLAVLRKRYPETYLLIVGPDAGHGLALQALAAQLGVADRVRFVGELRGDELKSAFQESDLFGFLSQFENFGAAIAEALAYGLPAIISRDIGDAARFQASGAVRVVSRNASDFAEAAGGFLADPAKMKSMSKSAREFARTSLSPLHSATIMMEQLSPYL
ncbi:MAG TPA: hypothetical protein DCM68_05960 [Verrucomicrobia bacterium]|nr:hypothetical protein [Verrucomicrobiota bacterium]